MSSFLASGFVRCQGCNKPFKRLSTHIAQNEICGTHYKTNPVQGGGIMSRTCKEVIAPTLIMKLLVLLLLHKDGQGIIHVFQVERKDVWLMMF